MTKRLMWLILLLALVLAGCGTVGGEAELVEATVTPLPTTNPTEGLRVTVSKACHVATLPTIQVDEVSGDMMGWNSDSSIFAYIAPTNGQWGWYSGNLVLKSMETGETSATRDLKAVGDITWSPEGSRIAFIGLQSPENLYTAMVLQISDMTVLDLYSTGAAIDDFGSKKGILAWSSGSSQVRVVETCGVDCSRVVGIDLIGQTHQILSTGRMQDDHSLEIVLNQKGITPHEDWFLTDASPDGSHIFYVDEDGQAWIVTQDEGSKYRLELDLEDVLESKWSPDSKLIAVRTNQMIFLYDLSCSLDWVE